MDITHDNVCSSMLSCFYSHLLSTGRPISSLFLLLEIYNVFRGIGKPYVKSLDSWSDLPDRCVQSIVS